MRKFLKILLVVISFLSFLGVAFWWGIYFLNGLTYLYHDENVVKRIYDFCAIAFLVLAVVILLVTIFLSRKSSMFAKVISTILLIVFDIVAFFAGFMGMLILVLGGYGCSYTEDVANYGKYDEGAHILADHFPEKITGDMTVVDFVYYYTYIDANQEDLYLEVTFNDGDMMESYLNVAMDAFSENGLIVTQNPYNDKYTDVYENRWVLWSGKYGSLTTSIIFDDTEPCNYVDMYYSSITYSYDELTIIYNFTGIGSDIIKGGNPNEGYYIPKFLQRFGVEYSEENNYMYKYEQK